MENFNWNICLLILAVLLYDVTKNQKEVRIYAGDNGRTEYNHNRTLPEPAAAGA